MCIQLEYSICDGPQFWKTLQQDMCLWRWETGQHKAKWKRADVHLAQGTTVLTSVGFIIVRYTDFPSQSCHTTNPEDKDAWLFLPLLLCMKKPQDAEEVDLRAAGSVSDDWNRVIWLTLDWIQQAINILICLCGQCAIRYINTLCNLRDSRSDLNSTLSLSIAWTIPMFYLVGHYILKIM